MTNIVFWITYLSLVCVSLYGAFKYRQVCKELVIRKEQIDILYQCIYDICQKSGYPDNFDNCVDYAYDTLIAFHKKNNKFYGIADGSYVSIPGQIFRKRKVKGNGYVAGNI